MVGGQRLRELHKNSIGPKGLRITLLPALRARSPNLMKRWEHEVTTRSLNLMNLLLKEVRITLENTSQKRKTTIVIALKLNGEDDFQKKETELQNNIEKYMVFLKERKHQQFVRDLTEFKENRVYLFLNSSNRRPVNSDISLSKAEYSDNERVKNTSNPQRSPFGTRIHNRGGWHNSRQRGNRGSNYMPSGPTRGTSTITGTSSATSSSSSATATFLEKAHSQPHLLESSDLSGGAASTQSGQIINLSKRNLTNIELYVLGKGISFVPSARFNLFSWVNDLHLFVWKLKWRKFFTLNDHKRCQELGLDPDDLLEVHTLVSILEEEDHDPPHGPFSSCKLKSPKMPPPGCDDNLYTFLFMVVDSLERLEGSETLNALTARNHNMTRTEMQALKNLERDTSITIKPADKGGNLVIMDSQQYHNMCLTILSDRDGYSILERDPTDVFHTELKNILQRGSENHLIDWQEFEFLLPTHS